MNRDFSKFRLYSMRFLYLFSGIVIGIGAWPEIINPSKPGDPIHAIAFSLYAAYSPLMLLGVRLPIRMLPLLLLQILYKVIWLVAGHSSLVSGMGRFFAIVVVLDLIVIPWPYVFQNYVKAVFKGEGKQASLSEEVRG